MGQRPCKNKNRTEQTGLDYITDLKSGGERIKREAIDKKNEINLISF